MPSPTLSFYYNYNLLDDLAKLLQMFVALVLLYNSAIILRLSIVFSGEKSSFLFFRCSVSELRLAIPGADLVQVKASKLQPKLPLPVFTAFPGDHYVWTRTIISSSLMCGLDGTPIGQFFNESLQSDLFRQPRPESTSRIAFTQCMRCDLSLRMSRVAWSVCWVHG